MSREPIHPNGDNTTAQELVVLMGCVCHKREFIRIAVIRSLLLGVDRKMVPLLFGVSGRVVQLWISIFNESGVDGLLHKPAGGRPRTVNLQKVKETLEPVLENPCLANEVFWTGKKLHGYLKKDLQIEISYSSVIRYLHELNYRLKFPRPWAQGPTKDEKERERFKLEIQTLRQRKDVELWFSDECGIEGDPRPRQRWAKRGTVPTIDYFGGHLRRSVIGAVNPENGELFSLVFHRCNTEIFQAFINEMAKAVPKKDGISQYIILDNASWHKTKKMNWHHFLPMYLPPYSPDLNPIERLWARVKADFFTDFVTRDGEALTQRICDALCAFMDNNGRVASICSIAK